MSLGARIRQALRGRQIAVHDRWSAYLREVEPTLNAVARVHRFAEVPTLGDPGLAPEPVAVWIEGDGAGDALQATRRALEAATRSPVGVLGGPLEQALAQTRAERVLLVSAGDALAPLALERFGQAAVLAPGADVITCDEDEVDGGGRRHRPRLRPAPSPDWWLACDASGASLLVAREAAAAALTNLSGDRAWRHELALALCGPAGERAAHVPMILTHRAAGAPASAPLAAQAVQRIVGEWGAGARVQRDGDIRWVRRPVRGEPSIEVIVCLRDQPHLLQRCVDSLLQQTDYERLAVTLIDNGSQESRTLELLGRYERDGRARVVHDASPFNFAALNNGAARRSEADLLVFLNNDTEILDPEWGATLAEEALRPEVGAVAPLLVYPDGKVQHAGAALGLHGYAGHPFAGLDPSHPTAFGRANGGTRNWMAVTAACMMVQRSKFEAVGGFDESFVVAGNDVDLCLRLTNAGYRSLCVPHAVVVHDESRSRGAHIDPGDFVRSERSYGRFRTVGDPFYNPNLTLDATDCSVRVPDGWAAGRRGSASPSAR
jgi:GT2 family glycosyltransferase